ncbi:MAG: Ppx/GppA family phosphatase, partial [Candidatus Sericytochromatia bacterium]|nr:Ppx/GppA family phosphatase [Candidatus Sericytochromatia bacterium]
MGHRIGIIDLGSNTARLVIYNYDPAGLFVEQENLKRVLRLSARIQFDGRLDQQAFDETIACFQVFRRLCDVNGVTEIVAVATAAVRQAVNGHYLINRLYDETGIRVRLLTGEEEAGYIHLAAAHAIASPDAIVVDLGGGSAEFIRMIDRQRLAATSMPFGAVNLTLNFTENDTVDAAAVGTFLRQQFRFQPWLMKAGLPIIASGGMARTIAKIHQRRRQYSLPSVHHYALSRAEFADLATWLLEMPPAARSGVSGLPKHRVDLIVAGLTFFQELMAVSDSPELIINAKGLREGMIVERLLTEVSRMVIDDPLAFCAGQLLLRHDIRPEHPRHVSRLACSLFDQFVEQGLFVAQDSDRRLLENAALLHDVGRAIDVHESEQHTFYLLSNVLTMGVTHRDRVRIALIASFRAGKTLKNRLQTYGDIVDKEDEARQEAPGSLVLLAR